MSRVARLGEWLFRRRTALPIPLILALLLIPPPAWSARAVFGLVAAGTALITMAEALRLWAVHHIGVISRTRSDRLGPLVSSGPFALVRNPLYLGNIALWTGFALAAQLPWLVPMFLVVLAAQYHAIVRWEEELLAARRGDEYRAYAARVPRWIPRLAGPRPAAAEAPPAFSWRETLFSERGTLMAIGAGALLLWLKGRALG